jgi:hypothetical protein
MPESKGRSKKRTRYQLEPQRKKKSKKSPRWYAPLVLTMMGVGVLLIVANYLQIVPGTQHQFEAKYLFMGLGLIGVGFIGTTLIR